MSFPYSDRPMWLYSRSSDKHLKVLFQQMQNLLDEAERREYTVAGTSQDMGSGKSMARMGLKQMMRAVKDGLAQAVLVQNLTRLSHDPAILMKIMRYCFKNNRLHPGFVILDSPLVSLKERKKDEDGEWINDYISTVNN